MLNSDRERALMIRACVPVIVLLLLGLGVLGAAALGWRPARTGPDVRVNCIR